jgi:hypothetical protein
MAEKASNPKADIPELDEPDPIEEIKKELAEKTAALEKKLADSEASRDQEKKLSAISQMQEAGYAKLRREQKYTDEGLKALKEIMDQKGILDPLDAAAIFERDHPPPPPVSPRASGSSWNFADPPSEETNKKFFDDLMNSKGNIPDMALSWYVNETINDVRSR